MKWWLCPMVGGHLAQDLVDEEWYASISTCLYSMQPGVKAGFRTEKKHSSPLFFCSDASAAIGDVLMFGFYLGSTNLLFSNVNKINQCFKAQERYLMKVASLFPPNFLYFSSHLQMKGVRDMWNACVKTLSNKGWRASSAVKSVCCYCRGSTPNSQCPYHNCLWLQLQGTGCFWPPHAIESYAHSHAHT